MTARAEKNRLQSIADRAVFPVDLGELNSREVVVILESLGAAARAYGRHPRANVCLSIGERLIERAIEQSPTPLADGHEVEDAEPIDVVA